MNKTFKFYLKSGIFYLYINSQGGISMSSQKVALKYAPLDWEKITIGAKSSSKEWIARREYSEPMQFVLDGAQILRHLFYTDGFLAKCVLEIEKLNTYDQSYSFWNSCTIDFSQFEDDADSVTVNMLEFGLIGLINSRREVSYELPLSSQENIWLKGVKLSSRARWVIGDSQSDSPVQYTGSQRIPPMISFGDNVQAGNFIAPFTIQSYEYNDSIIGLPSAPYFNENTSFVFTGTDLFDVNMRFQIPLGVNFKTHNPPSGTSHVINVRILIVAEGGTYSDIMFDQVIHTSSPIPNNVWSYPYLDFSYDFPIVIPENHYIVLILERKFSPNTPPTNSATESKWQFFADTSILDMRYNARVAPSACKGYRYIDMVKELISKMTDGLYTVQSNFLSNQLSSSTGFRVKNYDNSPYDTRVTSGDSLRSKPESVLKLTLNDILLDVWSRWGLSWTVLKNKLIIEPIEYFWSNIELFKVELSGKVKVSYMTDKTFVDVKVGYRNYDNDVVDGVDEFNSQLDFLSSANTVTTGTEDLLCPFRADVFGIESIRSKTWNEESKDNRFDNHIFVIETNPVKDNNMNAYLPLYPSISQGQFIGGVTDPENIYNVTLSPKRSLLRHMRRLKSLVSKGVLKFQTSERNANFESNLWAGYIKESDDINLENNTFNPIFKPYVLEFEAVPPYNLNEILSMGQRGYVSFYQGDILYKGFIMDVACTPSTRESYTFKLISHRDNDLTLLNRK